MTCFNIFFGQKIRCKKVVEKRGIIRKDDCNKFFACKSYNKIVTKMPWAKVAIKTAYVNLRKTRFQVSSPFQTDIIKISKEIDNQMYLIRST